MLDTDRGHIQRSFGVDIKRCWKNGIRIEVISYIGKANQDLREDAQLKVDEFNSFLSRTCPEDVDSDYFPIPLWIADFRSMNGGKLSLIRQYYMLEPDDPPVIAMIDDSPEVCYEVESGNVRAYRIFGGTKKWQRHEAHQPVFRNFTSAVDALLSDFEAGAVPLAPPRDEMKTKRGVKQLLRR